MAVLVHSGELLLPEVLQGSCVCNALLARASLRCSLLPASTAGTLVAGCWLQWDALQPPNTAALQGSAVTRALLEPLGVCDTPVQLFSLSMQHG